MKKHPYVVITLWLIGSLLIGFQALASPPPGYFVDETKLPFDALPGTQTTRLVGVHQGAGYRIEVPADWNGELVLYAHGFRGNGLELTVSNPRLREYFVTHGYAWAASSYSTNGYDVKQGVKDTHALARLFKQLVAKPTRTYLTGHSMGGHITGVSIEQYPHDFDGALPMCGVMGDRALFDYFLDYNLVAQALAGYPAAFPPPADYLIAVVPSLKTALWTSFPNVANAQGAKLRAMTQQRSGGTRPFFNLSFSVWADFLFTLNGDGTLNGLLPGNTAGNAQRVYQLDADPQLTPEEWQLNDLVLRVTADPQTQHPNGLANVPPINGDFRIPVVSLHTIGDLFVPISMQQIYAQRAAANHRDPLLVQRAYRDVGHCGFSVQEENQAFTDLVKWVKQGVKPAGDNLLDPATVAEPTFGCQFTQPARAYAPCP